MKFLQHAFPALAALLLGGAALAQAGTPPVTAADPASLGAFDTNRDGSISPSEAAVDSTLTGQFVMLDTNRSGALEPAEFARFEPLGTPPPNPSAPGTPPPAGTPPPGR